MKTLNDPKIKLEQDFRAMSSSFKILHDENDKIKNNLKSLLNRIRGNSEAAPWVIEEIRKILGEK